MIAVPFLLFALLALAAIAFTVFSIWRGKVKGGVALGGALALFLLGIGGGTYWMLGQPSLALRAAEGLHTRDIKGLVPFLITRVRKDPDDIQAWAYLGRAYMTANDPGDAAKAYARALTVARLAHQPTGDLASAYGEALVAEANGAVGPEAEAAFKAALAANPKDPAGRYFLGQALAARGDRASALTLWQSLMADVPVNAPLHQALVDRIAMLTAQNGMKGGAPDPLQMVAGLAARLKADPNDAAGWQRLIRAYAVLGQTGPAKDALGTARRTFAGHGDVLANLRAEAKDLKLE